MIRLDLQFFGGGGGGSGGRGSGGTGEGRSTSIRLSDEISSAKGISEKAEYILFTNRGETKGKITGADLLERINNKKTLTPDKETGMWRGSKGLYVIRKIIRRNR